MRNDEPAAGQLPAANQNALTTYYSAPWADPTVVVVRDDHGTYYDIRESWGCREGWTNAYVALPMREEAVADCAGDLTPLSKRDLRLLFSAETLLGIEAAVRKAQKEKDND